MSRYRPFLEAEEALAEALSRRSWEGVEAALSALSALPLPEPEDGEGEDWTRILTLHEANRRELAAWMEEVKRDLRGVALPPAPPPPPPRWLDRRG